MKNRMSVTLLWAAALILSPALAPAQQSATSAPAPAAGTATTTGTAVTADTAAGATPVSTAPDNDAQLRETGRRLAKDLQQAIVSVRIVLSEQTSMGGQNSPETEIKGEASGTVIAPDGLTIVPLSVVDPAQLISRFRGEDMNVNSRVKDIRFIFPGSKRDEVPANVVLRDADLNIAFLRPKEKPAQPWKFIDLNQAVEPRLLEKVLVLARMGRIADRQIGVMTGEIQSLVSKPRRFYVPSGELASGGLGVPIYTSDAKVVGIVLVRTLAGDASDNAGGALSMNSSQSGMLVIVLPAKDVQEVAVQAPEEAEKQPASLAAPTSGTTPTTGTEETTGTKGAAPEH